jgi:hypothetical protein
MGVNLRRSAAISILLLLGTCPRPSLAAPAAAELRADQEAALRAKGNALMASSRWTEALPVWAELFGVGGKSLDLWNSAVCQYHLAEVGQAMPDQALALLRQYRDRQDVPEEKKAKAQRYIDQMTALKAQLSGGSNTPTSSPAWAVAAQPSSASAAVTSTPVPQQSFFERHEDAMRVAPWTAGAVGVAALGAGIYFSARTQSLDSKVTNEHTFSASDDSSGRQAQVLQYVMYGVSVVALATTGVLYEVSRHHRRRRLIGVLPDVTNEKAGLLMAISF